MFVDRFHISYDWVNPRSNCESIWHKAINSVTSVKIFWAIGVWVCYLAALIVHYLQGSQTKRTAQITVVGFMLMSLGLFGLTSWR